MISDTFRPMTVLWYTLHIARHIERMIILKRKQTLSLILAVLLQIVLLAGCDSNLQPYEEAEALFADMQYEQAAAAFEALGNYKDAAERAEAAWIAHEIAREKTLGDTFTFMGAEITYGPSYEWLIINDPDSDKDGADVIKIPRTVNGDDMPLNAFIVGYRGSKGDRLPQVGSYFNDDEDNGGFVYLLYDGDGDYFIDYITGSASGGLVPIIEIKIPIKK